MPFAGINSTTVRKELKSIQEGYVVLRRMTYGEKLTRQDMMKMTVEMGSKSKDLRGELAMANKMATHSDFANCIIDHNLEKDEQGNKFNFKDFNDFVMLDPRAGEEIDKYINELNNFEDSDEGNV